MERWVGRVALVTGASSGIGAAVAERLVRQGMKVIGCARNSDQIQELSSKLSSEKGELLAMKCDLQKEEDILAMFKKIKEDHGAVDVCINNAGLAHNAPLLSGSTDHWKNMLEVNVLALSICTREAYTLMKEKKIDDGQFIHINSVVGHVVPKAADVHFYSATKFAVRALLDGLRNEIKPTKTKIRVCEISPGVVETNFRVRMSGEEHAEKAYSSMKCLQGEDIADAVESVLKAPAHVEVFLNDFRAVGRSFA